MKKVRLGDIATVITKGTTPTTLGYNFVDDGVNFVKIESITENGEFLTDKFAHITDECDRKLSRSQLQQNDLLFSIAGAIGRTAIVTEDILPANTNQALAIIRVPEGQVDYSYLKYVLQSPDIVEQFEKKKQGVAQLNISLKDIGDFVIPLCTEEEQKTVVSTLDKVSELIDLRKEQLAKLDQLIKSRFIELFGDPLSNDKGWQKALITEVCHAIFGGGTPSKSHPEYFTGSIPWVSPKDMKFSVISDSIDHITEEAIAHSTTNLVPANSVLMVIRSGILKHTLPVAINSVPVTINQDMKAFVPSEAVKTAFLMHYFKAIENDVLSGVRGVTADNIDFKAFQKRTIIVPPLVLQEQFAAFVEQTDKSKLAIQQSLDKLELLKKALMQKYFG